MRRFRISIDDPYQVTSVRGKVVIHRENVDEVMCPKTAIRMAKRLKIASGVALAHLNSEASPEIRGHATVFGKPKKH